ncbi:MAG: hypothetical protein WC481_07715 [Candidatus Omnitrophota bacterium]
MKSAEEFATDIGITLLEYYGPREGAMDKITALIRARDKEIVEACKKAVHGEDWRGHCGRGPAIDDALDSVLGTLG